MQALRFAGKVAFVTGAGQGIGRAIALRFAREGAVVLVNDLPDVSAAAANVVDRIRTGGGMAFNALADVSDRAQFGAAIDTALHGRIDVLVNNAGRAVLHDALTMTTDDLDDALRVNLHGVINGTQLVAPAMQAQRYGKIVSTASIAAYGTAVRSTTPYAIAKTAVAMYTKRAAMELGACQVNVNCVCPGRCGDGHVDACRAIRSPVRGAAPRSRGGDDARAPGDTR
jgi:3-oxoacyl-[acyl-carrier protein] reductase